MLGREGPEITTGMQELRQNYPGCCQCDPIFLFLVCLFMRVSVYDYRLVGLVVMASASRAEDPGFDSRLRRNFYGRVILVTLKLPLLWLPLQAPGVIGVVLGLAGPPSV